MKYPRRVVAFFISGLLIMVIATATFYGPDESNSPNFPPEVRGQVGELIVVPNAKESPIDSDEYDKSEDTSTGSIVFPNGASFQFSIRKEEQGPGNMPKVLANQFFDLREAALSGDDGTSLLLHRGLTYCNSYGIDSQVALDEALNQLAQFRTVQVLGEDGSISSQYVDDEDGYNQLVEAYEFCKGITEEQKAETASWLKHSADLGNPRAIQQFVMEEEGNTEEGRRYLKSAFESGWYNAGGQLASYYSKTYSEVMGLPDLVTNDVESPSLAYAYQFLFTKALEVDVQNLKINDQAKKELLDTYRKQLVDLENSISVRDKELGLIEAEQMMRNYRGCCISIF